VIISSELLKHAQDGHTLHFHRVNMWHGDPYYREVSLWCRECHVVLITMKESDIPILIS
jgi:hypothetical protein